MKLRLDLKTPEKEFKNFEYWQKQIQKADLVGTHNNIEMIDVEQIVRVNEKRIQMDAFIESITRDNRLLI